MLKTLMMAKVNYNVITHGLSGKVGDLVVFSQRFGQTIVGKLPQRSDSANAAQLTVRERFKQAARYAKGCIQDPAIKAIYAVNAAGGVTAYNRAFADFFTPPVVDNVETGAYTGAVGSSIQVMATDDTKVEGVHFRIIAANGTVIEEGAAVKQGDTDQWLYTATVQNASPAGSKIVVEARDMPGNVTTKEQTL